MDKPLVSIIVPNYNHEKYLKQRLDSIFNQTYQNFEIILLDDCSTDKSVEILKEYSKSLKVSHFKVNKKNSGSTFKQWQKGISLAKGEYIWIAESDDFCETNFIENIIHPLLDNDVVSLSFCQSNRVNDADKVTGNWISQTNEFLENKFENNFMMEGNIFIEKYLIHKNVIPNVSAVILRKDIIDKFTPLTFKPFMKYNADWYYYIQIICNNKVAFIAEPLNSFRFHKESVIAKAGEDSGWLNIYKMELQSRNHMLKFIENSKPYNLKEIRKQSKIGDNKFTFLIASGFINRGYNIKGLLIVYNKPNLLKKISLKLLKKIWNTFQ